MYNLLKCVIFILLIPLSVIANEISIPINLSSQIPVIEATLGSEPILLSFDSGSGMQFTLKQKIISMHKNMKPTGKAIKTIDAVGKINVNPEYTMPEININKYKIRDAKVYLLKPWGLSIGNAQQVQEQVFGNIDGVMGLSAFNQQNFIVDYHDKKLVLFSEQLPDQYNNLNWSLCPATIDENGITLFGAINGIPATFVLDTGATRSFIKPAFLNLKNEKTANLNINLQHISIQQSFMVQNFVEPKVDGILGFDFLENVLVHVDMEHKEINVAKRFQ